MMSLKSNADMEKGNYWVTVNGKHEIAYCTGKYKNRGMVWKLHGSTDDFYETDFEQIWPDKIVQDVKDRLTNNTKSKVKNKSIQKAFLKNKY